MPTAFNEYLQRYAEIVIRVGLNMQPGQRLFIVRAPIAAAPLVRAITARAYQAGARLVDVLWRDDDLVLNRFLYAPRDSFTEHAHWRTDGWRQAAERGDAILSIRGEDPDLLADQDQDLISQMYRTTLEHSRPALNITGKNGTNWLVIAAAIPTWAEKVFPDLEEEAALRRLWDTIFSICRLESENAIATWEHHLQELQKRRAYMNGKRYTALHCKGPGTDLNIGLAKGHLWAGGMAESAAGVQFTPNLPTEEIFTMPDRMRVEGVVSSSMPLSYANLLIEDFTLHFSEGRVVQATAHKGEALLKSLLNMDDGSGRLGEVALVPHSSPIAQLETLFFDGLLDENAASHLALGSAYANNLQGGESMTKEELLDAGANHSLNHVDFMIGSARMDIDGITEDGQPEAVMRKGEWAFDV